MDRKNQRFTRQMDLDYDDLGDGVRRKVLAYGEAMMQVQVEFEKGAIGKLHSHPHVQLTYILEGAFEFNIGGEVQVVRKGDTLYKLPNVEHGCVCLEEGILLDTFTPMRDEFVK